MEQLINITDAVFLGHVGEVELGASALAGIYYLATYMLGFGFSIGLQVMIARRNGEQNYAETGRTFFQGLFFLSGLALSLCLLIQGLSPFLLKQLITSLWRTGRTIGSGRRPLRRPSPPCLFQWHIPLVCFP